MFGNPFGNFQEKQEELKQKLQEIEVEAEAGDGAVKITANAARQILNIQIDSTKIDPSDTENLEDLILVAINRVIKLATEKELAESQAMLKDILPPGLGGLGKLFGK